MSAYPHPPAGQPATPVFSSFAPPQAFTAADANLTGIIGGRYVYSVAFTGTATVALQALAPKVLATDADVWIDVVSKTATGTAEVIIGQDAVLRVHVASGTPTGLAASIARYA